MVRHLHPSNQNPRRIRKVDKLCGEKLDLIKFPVKVRDIHKIERKNSIDISAFGYENKGKYPIYVSKKCCEDKHVDLLLIGVGEKKHYVLNKDFKTFMYDRTLHHGRKHFCRSCLQAFRTAKTLKYQIKDYFKIKVNK